MQRNRVLSATFAFLVLAGTAATTSAGAAESARCAIEIPDLVLDPGLATEPNSGVFGTTTETGTIDCGRNRRGTIGVDGRYGTKGPASCQSGGEGWAVLSVTLGNERFKDPITFTFGATSDSVLAGEATGRRISGRYTFTGTEGNCATAPITKGTVKFLEATLTG